MGNVHIKVNKTKQQRAECALKRANATQQTKAKVEQAERVIMNGSVHSMDMTRMDDEKIATLLKITQKAKDQLDRQGEKQTKSDLIAIIVALDPKYARNIDAIQANTVKDLNAMIRTMVYDPSRYTGSMGSLENGGAHVSNQKQEKKAIASSVQSQVIPVKKQEKTALVPASKKQMAVAVVPVQTHAVVVVPKQKAVVSKKAVPSSTFVSVFDM